MFFPACLSKIYQRQNLFCQLRFWEFPEKFGFTQSIGLLSVYDDIVNIVSPGSLPYSITIEDVFNGRSEARNRVVAHVFKELNLIEQWGSGINRIISDCKAHGLQTPKIEEKNDFFDVEIIRPIADEKSGKDKVTDDYEQLKEAEKTVLLYLKDNKTITRKQAIELLNLQKTKVHEILAGLVSKNLIVMQGQGRSTYYSFINDHLGR